MNTAWSLEIALTRRKTIFADLSSWLCLTFLQVHSFSSTPRITSNIATYPHSTPTETQASNDRKLRLLEIYYFNLKNHAKFNFFWQKYDRKLIFASNFAKSISENVMKNG